MSWGCVSCFLSPIDPLYHAGGFGDPGIDFAMSPAPGSMKVVYDGKLPIPKPLPTCQDIVIVGSAEWRLPSTQCQDFGRLLKLRAKFEGHGPVSSVVRAMVIHVLGYRPTPNLLRRPASCVQRPTRV